ncbi:MAG TPA: hypothetical protein VLB02_00150 [Candidatus Paceibacterota bacterium]|nr:hypothetical protein [Candidatus Paceibacterota bacterium]
MHIVSVIPIQKGIPFDSLTYFSQEPLPQGFLVKVPIQSREVLGTVVSSKPLSDAKLDVKASLFSLKKIAQIIGPGSLDETFLDAAIHTARTSFAPLGALLGELLPEGALEQRQYITRAAELPKTASHTSLIQGTHDTRLDEYKVLIRETLGHGHSVLLIAPTIAKAEAWHEALVKGIERRTHLLHSECTKTDMKKTYRELFQATKGVLLIATPRFATLPWFTPETLLIDEPSHVGYSTRSRFEIDYREFFTTLGKARGAHIYIGDHLLPFPYIWAGEKKVSTLFPRRYVPEKLQTIDLSGRPFEPLSKELVTLVRHVDATEKSLFIYAQRKGVAPYSVCRTCKTVVVCTQCQTALILKYVNTSNGKERTFICPECGASEPTSYLCAHCGSWDIEAQEIGTDATLDAIRALELRAKLIVIESDRGSDESLREQLASTGPKIIVGTERAFSLLESVAFAAVPHFDRLLSRTALDAGERTLRLLYTLDTLTHDAVILLTKNPKQALIAAIEKKELAPYVAAEGDIARALGYPPFGTILKLAIRVPAAEKERATELVMLAAKPLEAFHVSSKRTRPGASYVTLSFIIKAGKSFFESNLGTYERLLENLGQLPYRAHLENNPKTLF